MDTLNSELNSLQKDSHLNNNQLGVKIQELTKEAKENKLKLEGLQKENMRLESEKMKLEKDKNELQNYMDSDKLELAKLKDQFTNVN
mmetsp:Transcript_43180/g.41514  ORF Transcript_43180/g.41514 Transcript_43180/m.41514 type:complete len:87 (-) Transcript_43180:222-482(-)